MLINPKKYLVEARKNSYAIGAFNTSDLEITQAILQAAFSLKAPVIVATSESAIKYAGLENLVSIIKNEAKKYEIPIALHLDHGRSFEIAKKCLEVGYTSVMIDGSKLEFAKNVELTKKVVDLAKKFQAQVEAEIGAVGGKEDYIKSQGNKTDPKKAQEFVELTGVDSLAVAFGNAHDLSDRAHLGS